METITIVLTCILLLRGIFYLLNSLSAIKVFLNTPDYSSTNIERVKPIKIIILMPLLRETRILEQMMKYFAPLLRGVKGQMLLITTEKESVGLDKNEKSTRELAEELIAASVLEESNLFKIVHYPHTSGQMGHQLNYALDNIHEVIPGLEEESTYIGVYNADSLPNPNTFNVLTSQALTHLEDSGKFPKVFQQVAIFTSNYENYTGNFLSKWLLKAASIIQSRWSLGYEYWMLSRQSAHKNPSKNVFEYITEPISYCVGHGLFIRLDTIKQIGKFPTETLNEDLPLGYYLTLSNIPIRPLNVLEIAESPATLKQLINQKRSWFWGMIDYFTYLEIAPKRIPKVSRLRAFIVAIRSLIRDAVSWLFTGISLVTISIYILVMPNTLNITLGVLTILVYFVATTYTVLHYLKRLHVRSIEKPVKVSLFDYILIPIFGYLYIIISCIGPWISLLNLLGKSILGIELRKPKTER